MGPDPCAAAESARTGEKKSLICDEQESFFSFKIIAQWQDIPAQPQRLQENSEILFSDLIKHMKEKIILRDNTVNLA